MEWTVVTTIISLVGIVGVFVKVAVSLTSSMQKNTDATERLNETVGGFRKDNEKDHDVFRDTLKDHEHRITVMEAKNEK